MAPILHWFRRDLRLHDNTALAAAVADSGGMVIPVFVLDDRLIDPQGRFTSAARIRFLLESLRVLDENLRGQHSALVFRRGDPPRELLLLARQTNAQAVYWNRDYSPYAVARDTAVAQELHAAGYSTKQFKDAVIWEHDEIMTKAGTPYKVYTPYARQWKNKLAQQGVSLAPTQPLRMPADDLPVPQPIPDLVEIGFSTDQQTIPGGEQHGQRMLQAFADTSQPHRIAGYATGRDMLALPATSRLSAHLRLGTVSPRQCVEAALAIEQAHPDAAEGVQTWIGELAWRDFYVQILAHFPHVLRGAFRQHYNNIAWQNNQQWFAAWCAGQTGYPVVDAAMRQLTHEAWMHNRARMIVASFLTKDLLIDWRWGERYFMQQLVDGDPAANNGGWQWAAGTGTDAQPYFRIFNPSSQGKKFDPDGDYVRRYVPELANVPDRFIHEPWKMPTQVQQQYNVGIGHTYPAPIVEHKARRQQALALYKAASASSDA